MLNHIQIYISIQLHFLLINIITYNLPSLPPPLHSHLIWDVGQSCRVKTVTLWTGTRDELVQKSDHFNCTIL